MLKKIICVFLAGTLATSLTGCIPAAIAVSAAVGATAGGAVIYDKRSTKTMAQDQEAEKNAGFALNKTPSLNGTHIVLATFHHVMLMVGQVNTEDQRNTAQQIVSQIKNVSRVYNELTVQSPTSKWQRSRDAWITTKIKSEMLVSPGLHSTEIKVVTENNVVYLMGEPSHHQAQLATNVARRVDGVQKVVEVFENP